MKLKNLRKYFYDYKNDNNKKEFVIRVRKDGDKVYYRGIKIFDIEKGNLTLSDNIFHLSDAYIKENKEVLSDKISRMEKLRELATLRTELINNNCMKLADTFIIKYKMSDAKAYFFNEQAMIDKANHLEKIKVIIKNELNDYINIYDDYCEVNIDKLNTITDKVEWMTELLNIEYVVMHTFIYFDDINWTDKNNLPYTNKSAKSGWVKPNISFVKPDSYKIEALDENLLDDINGRVCEAIDNYLKMKFEEEKNYQHQFMLDDLILDKFRKLNIENLYRVEEEYYTKDNEERGRIDSMFISKDGEDIYIIELKVNDNVIGGTNGIHKHLIDIENLYLENNIDNFIKDLKEIVDYRRIELDEDKIIWKEEINVHFYTVIACDSNDMKDKIEKMLDAFNNKDSQELTNVKNAIKKEKSKYKDRVLTLREHIDNLNKCDVRFYFDMISVTKEKDKIKNISILDKDFIPYDIK